MTTLCVRHPRSIEQYAGAWAISLAVHGLALCLFLALVTTLHLPPDPNIFRWDVALVNTPEPEPETAPAQLESAPSHPISDRSLKSSELTASRSRTVPVEAQPIPTPVDQAETVQVIERAKSVKSVQTVQMPKPVTRQEMETVTAIPQEIPVSEVQQTRESSTVVSQPVQTAATAVQTPATTAMSAGVESSAIAREARPLRETALVPSTRMTYQDPVVTHNQRVTVAPGTGTEHSLVETQPLASRPRVEAKIIQEPTRQAVPDKTGAVKANGPVEMRRSKPAFIKLEASPERSASFRWLTEAIKRSETQRRPIADHEGTTHFRITMRQDGRTVHLLDLSVAESSGHPQVDRAAADLIRRSFPIELTEPMAQSQVRIDLPVTIHTN